MTPPRCGCWPPPCGPCPGSGRRGAIINRRLYLPEYSLAGRDPSFGRDMDLSLVMASLMNRWGEDILPEEVAYTMLDKRHHRRPQRRLCRGCRRLLRLFQLAGLAGSEGPAGPDPRRLFGGGGDGDPPDRPAGAGAGMRWPCGALATTTRSWQTSWCLNDPTAPGDGAVARTMSIHRFSALLHRAGHHPAAQAPHLFRYAAPPVPLRAGSGGRRGVVLYPERGQGPPAGGFQRLGGLYPVRRGGPRHHRPQDLPTA